MKKINIIGIGMGNSKTITMEAREQIEQANILIGATRMINTFNNMNKPYVISTKSEEILDYINKYDYENICVLYSGDTGFYSGARLLAKKIKDYSVKIYPGISSLSYFCARLKMSWEQVYPVSIHGRTQNLIPAIRSHEKTFVLTDGNINGICKKLIESELEYVQIYIGEYLSYDNERILKGMPAEFLHENFDTLSVLMIINKHFGSSTRTGIPDKEFIRGNVPMTKSEVRAIILSKLQLKNNSCAYDIGAGTGSVSVEMALNAPFGTIYAIEQNPDGITLIKKNQAKFGLGNLKIIKGMAPEILSKLPSPDTVFIGGSKGQLRDILQLLQQSTQNRIRVVCSAITIETLSQLCDLIKELNIKESEIIQIAMSKAKGIGGYHLMNGLNPVYIVSGYLENKENSYES